MKVAMFAVTLLAAASLVGCSSESAALAKAKADADAGRVELAKAQAEAEAAKTELALLKKTLLAEPKGKPKERSEDDEKMDVGKRFVSLLQADKAAVAYDDLTSVSYQKQNAVKTLEELIKQHAAIKRLEPHEASKHELKKTSDSKAYIHVYRARPFKSDKEWNAHLNNAANVGADPSASAAVRRDSRGTGPWIEFTLTIIHEGGAWKVDQLEITAEKP